MAATLAGYAHRVGQSREGEALRSFTAIGVVTSGEIYQVEMSPDFRPYRVDVSYLDCREAPIKPLETGAVAAGNPCRVISRR